MESIDIVNPDGSSTGKAKPRKQIHIDGDWHRTVHVWIMNNNEEMLLQRRAQDKDSHPGMWDVSCAGHICTGDTSRQTAVKELSEELGLDVVADRLRYLFTYPSFFILKNGAYIDRELIDVYMLIRDILPQEMKLQPEEVAAVKFMSLEKLRAKIEQPDSGIVPHTEGFRRLFAFLDQNSL